MTRLALRGLRAHARRFTSTILAVGIGVAFLTGVLVQVATIQATFDDMFATGAAGRDAEVRSATAIELGFGDTARNRIDIDLVDRVAATPGVRAAVGMRSGTAQITGADGELLGGGGPPQLGEQWIDDEAFNPFRIVDGRPPTAADEIVIDRASARTGDLQVGDTATVLVPEPTELRVVGIATYGRADSPGPVTMALFDESGGSRYLGTPDEVDRIAVDARPGTSQAELVESLSTWLPEDIEAITGTQVIDEDQQIGRDIVGFLRPALLAFAAVALVVAAFSIHNTFAIIVAQRTRDAALLRVVGASRRQIVGSTLVEAGLVGLIGAAIGVIGGLGIAVGLSALLSAFGGNLPNGGLVVEPSAVALTLAVGVGITLAAALMPAWRGSRVPPVAALRSVAIDGGRVSRSRAVAGLVLAVGGVGVALQAAMGQGDGAGTRAGLGAAVMLLAVMVLGPAVAGPLARLIGAPLSRIRGVTGLIARRNAVRNPRRTSTTATALVIGVAIVTLFTVVAASLRASINDTIDNEVAGDIIIMGNDFGIGGIDPGLAERIRELPEAEHVVGFAAVPMNLGGEDQFVNVADTAGVTDIIDLGVESGSVERLGADGVAISTEYAADHGLAPGDSIPARQVDGTEEFLTVEVLYRNESFAGGLFVAKEAVVGHVPELGDQAVMVTARSGASVAELDDAIEAAATPWPGLSIQDKAEYRETIGRSIDQILALIYVLLALSIGIALMGIANTMSLSTFERIRELGLLRAVGQTRRQVRSMVRWEAVVVSTLGTVVGMAVGVGAAWAVLTASASVTFNHVAVPAPTLTIVVVVGAAAGVLASARPAARAAKIDMLSAISTG